MENTRERSDLQPPPISDEALQALRESEGRYRALFDNMAEGFALFGVVRGSSGQVVDLIYREANKALERQTGFDRAKTIGQPLTAILTPSDAARFIPILAKAVDSGEPTTFEEYAEIVGRWFEVSAYAHGQDEIVAFYRDISERKRAEAVLRESEARHSLLIGSWAQAVWETDAHGVVIADSPSWRVYTGQTLQEWLGYGWLDAIHPDDRVNAERQWREAIAAHRLVNAEFRLRALNGDWRWTNVRAAPVLNAKGNIEKWAGINIDIEAHKRAETALRESEERQTFLLKLSDALRAEPSAEAIADRAVRMLFEKMRLDRCFVGLFFLEEDRAEYHHQVHDDRLPPLPAEVRISDFPQALQVLLDGSLVIDNIAEKEGFSDDERANIEALGLHALIDVTLRKGEKNPLWAIIAGSMHPRVWTPGEVALVEEVAERTWAAVDRAQAEAALRESEARRELALEATEMGTFLWHVEEDRGEIDGQFRILFGQPPDGDLSLSDAMTLFHPDDAAGYAAAVVEATKPDGSRELRHDLRVKRPGGGWRWIAVTGKVSFDNTGRPLRMAGTLIDITARNTAEAVIRDSEERQAFLLKLSDALRAEPSAEAIANRAIGMLFEQMRLDRCYVGIYRLAEDIAEFPHQVHDDRLPPVPAKICLSDFPDSFKIAFDRTLVIDNVAEKEGFSDRDRASLGDLGVRAFVAVTLRKGEKNPLWAIVAGSMHPRVWTPGEVALVEEVAERTWGAVERARAETALRDSEERFHEFSDASTNILWIRDTKTMRMEFASPAFDRIYGIPGPGCGGDGRLRSWARLIEPENRKSVLANFRRVRKGERVEQEFRIRRASNGTLRWIHDTGFPLRDVNGDVRYIAGVGADITDAKETTDRQAVLVEELQHRTRNLIAVVRALSDHTLGNAASLEDFGARFRLRLSALSRVQGLMSHLAAGEKVTFKELVCSELAVYGATDGMAHKFTLEGPDDVPLPSTTVQTFALAIHELATNAVKYGALAAVDGHLFVGWRIDPPVGNDPPRLHVEWRESGVIMPDVDAPAQGGGYGRELIERALPYQLKAKTTYEFGVDGVRCTIAVPIARTASNGIFRDE